MNKKIYVLLLLSIFIGSCKKDEPDSKVTPIINNTNNVQSDIYFYGEYTLGNLKWEAGINGDGNIAGVGTGQPNEYSSSFLRTPASDNISIKFILPQANPTLTDYNAFFKPGIKYFKTENTPDGVFFYHRDKDGVIWSTVLGGQTNSSFTITEVGNYKLNGTDYKFVEATFQCVLYNQSSSSFDLQNGKIKCLIPHFN